MHCALYALHALCLKLQASDLLISPEYSRVFIGDHPIGRVRIELSGEPAKAIKYENMVLGGLAAAAKARHDFMHITRTHRLTLAPALRQLYSIRILVRPYSRTGTSTVQLYYFN